MKIYASFLKGFIVGLIIISPIAYAGTITETVEYQSETPKSTRGIILQYIYDLADQYDVDRNTVVAIAKCESRLVINATNKNKNGTIDRGLLQVNSIHTKRAKDMGFDLNMPSESLEFGVWLMSKEGLRPWNSSKHCWKKNI